MHKNRCWLEGEKVISVALESGFKRDNMHLGRKLVKIGRGAGHRS